MVQNIILTQHHLAVAANAAVAGAAAVGPADLDRVSDRTVAQAEEEAEGAHGVAVRPAPDEA